MGVVEFCYLWGDLDFRCFGDGCFVGCDFGLSGVSLCLGSRWFLFGLMIRGYEFFMS